MFLLLFLPKEFTARKKRNYQEGDCSICKCILVCYPANYEEDQPKDEKDRGKTSAVH